jgi:uncharacterized membrane protein
MEDIFFNLADHVALFIEAATVVILALASSLALARITRMIIAGESALSIRRNIWLTYGAAIALALEFTLAADIIRSAIAPTWDAIGKLAAIAAIRIILNLFLMRDIESLSEKPAEK